ncbi:MAG: pobA 2 [Chloroflexi bacterium]|nr:pobA 2 [Chloroflexota bacterium]
MIASLDRSDASVPWQDLYHAGPGTLAGRFMRTFWQPVHLAKDLTAGKAKPIRILGEDFTLYRGEARPHPLSTQHSALSTAVPHVVDFRCAHRRTQLSIGWVEGDSIRCRYHGWAYDASGQCVEQPGEPEPFCERIRIRGYPTEEYLGLIFAYLGEGTAPPLPRFPDLETPGVLEVTTYVRDCNYFNNIENDPLHVPFTHRRADDPWPWWADGSPTYTAKETEFGVQQEVSWPNGRVSRDNKGLPNISYRLAPVGWIELQDSSPSDHLSWRVPIDDEHHLSFNVDHILAVGDKMPETRTTYDPALDDPFRTVRLSYKVLSGEAEMDDFGLPNTSLINLEDDVVQAGQGAIPDHENEHLGRSDAGVALRRKVWERELRALSEGRPLKQWRAPEPRRVSAIPASMP